MTTMWFKEDLSFV